MPLVSRRASSTFEPTEAVFDSFVPPSERVGLSRGHPPSNDWIGVCSAVAWIERAPGLRGDMPSRSRSAPRDARARGRQGTDQPSGWWFPGSIGSRHSSRRSAVGLARSPGHAASACGPFARVPNASSTPRSARAVPPGSRPEQAERRESAAAPGMGVRRDAPSTFGTRSVEPAAVWTRCVSRPGPRTPRTASGPGSSSTPTAPAASPPTSSRPREGALALERRRSAGSTHPHPFGTTGASAGHVRPYG